MAHGFKDRTAAEQALNAIGEGHDVVCVYYHKVGSGVLRDEVTLQDGKIASVMTKEKGSWQAAGDIDKGYMDSMQGKPLFDWVCGMLTCPDQPDIIRVQVCGVVPEGGRTPLFDEDLVGTAD